MKISRFPFAGFRRRAAVCQLSLASIMLLVPAASVAAADLRKAVKEVFPATVAVEWRSAESEAPSPAEGAKRPSKHPGVYAYQVEGGFNLPTLGISLGQLVARTPDAVSLASGTVVSADGLIVTVTGETGEGSYSVTFPDNRTLPARLLVDDRRSSLKLLKVDEKDLPGVELAEKEAELGQQVVAVFCRGPKSRAVSQGIIAGTDRRFGGSVCEVFETDAPVGTMSAGAPLADVNGRLLGIVAARTTGKDNEPGPALVIPAEYVQLLLEARQGDDTVVVERGHIGVSIQEPPEGKTSPVVQKVLPDTPAAEAGIREGDEIVAIDGRSVSMPHHVVQRIGRHKPGDEVVVTIRRDDEEKVLRATLGRRETEPKTAASAPEKVSTVVPGTVLIAGDDGQLKVVTPDGTARGLLALRQYQQALERARKDVTRKELRLSPAAPAMIRVQRSDVQKKLDQLSRDVQSLRKQTEKLAEEVKKLTDRLGNEPEEQGTVRQ